MQCIILSGLPGSGKTTYLSKIVGGDQQVLSTDTLIQQYADEHNQTYDQVFLEYIKPAEKIFNEQLRKCISNRQSIIIDRTNLSAKARRRILSQLPSGCKKSCVYFDVPLDVIKKRLVERNKSGKSISNDLLHEMSLRLVVPSLSEGFNHIIHVDENGKTTMGEF